MGGVIKIALNDTLSYIWDLYPKENLVQNTDLQGFIL